MKSYRSRSNARSRPFRLNHVLWATVSVVLFAGLNVFGWGNSPQAANAEFAAGATTPFLVTASQPATVNHKNYNLFNPAVSLAAANGLFFDTIADLAISKSDSIDTVNPGAQTTYVIRIKNNGTAPVIGATLTDSIGSPGLTLLSTACDPVVVSPANKCTTSPTLAQLTGAGVLLPTLQPGESYNLDVVAQVAAGPPYGDFPPHSVTNNAAVTLADQQGRNGAFDTNIVNMADLSVTKDDGSPTYTPGAPITYTEIVRNLGPNDATGVTVTDAVPAAITGVVVNCVASGAASCGTNGSAGNNVSFTGVALAPGAGNFLTITVSGVVVSSATGNLVNTVTVTPGGQLDTDMSNNSATDTDTPLPLVDLAINKTDGTPTYTPGLGITYTITVTNNGPSDATGASVVDTVPASITGVSIICQSTGAATCGTNGSAGNNVSFTGVNIAAGAGTNFLTITVSGTVSPSTTGDLVNTATVNQGNETDTNTNNNSSTDTDTSGGAQIDLSVTKTDGSDTYTAGNAITYTMVVRNAGPSNATGVTVTDPVPPAITGVSANCVASGSAACGTNASVGNNVSFTGATVPVGAANFLTITVSGTVALSTTGPLTNTVTVGPGAPTDSNPGNNTATDTDTAAGSANLVICKQLAPNDPIPVGTAFTFTSPSFPGVITVNAGPNGSPVCSNPITVAEGNVTVIETPRANTEVTSITADPPNRLVSVNLPNGSGVVNVPVSPVSTTMTFTNHGTVAPTGIVEICKQLADGDVLPVGTPFTFTVTGAIDPAGPYTVPAGPFGTPNCTGPITVAIGPQTITEQAVANTSVKAIDVSPANRLVSSDLPNGKVVVNVAGGDATNQTLVTYTNQTTRTGYVEICKYTADPTDTDVTGVFNFTVQGAPGTYSVQTGFCSEPIKVTLPQIGTTPFTTNITELARDNFRLERVDSTPTGRINTPPPGFVPNAGFDANGVALPGNNNGGYTNVTLNAGGANQMILVNFYNRSLPGRIKVCKVAADARIPATTDFLFDVSGTAPTSPTQTLPGVPFTGRVVVRPGSCIFVGSTFIVGTPVTVTEVGMSPDPITPGNYTFFDNIRVSSIVGNPGLTSSSLVGKTATLTARNTTAEVSFTNFIFQPAVLKLCKAAGPGSPDGDLFASFTLSLVDPLTSYPVNSTPIQIRYSNAAAGCTVLSGPFPATAGFPQGTFNLGTKLVVTEAQTNPATNVTVTSPTGNTVTQSGRAGTITLTQVPQNINEIRFVNTPVTVTPVSRARFDFDGDGKSDEVVFRNGNWLYAASGSGMALGSITFGLGSDKLVAADYDGDGKTDAAVYRNGTWFVNGSAGSGMAVQFGLPTDIPQVGDFDGDHKADFVVYRPSTGTWFMQLSTAGFQAVQFGISTDKPVAADFDGDGKADVAVYRDNTWYVLGSTAGFMGMQFGMTGDIPVQADYDGDGKADFAVYRSGIWYILGTATGFKSVNFGVASDTPVPADYDGDGKTDVAVYRTPNNTWFMLLSSQSLNPGGGFTSNAFGASGDVLMNY